jgi:outer membrane protein
MKNISLILNLILLVLVSWLYYKIYSGDCQPSTPAVAPVLSHGSGMPANAIVFINSDSLLENYDFFNSLKEELEHKQDSLDKVLRAQAAQLDREVNAYQERGATMSAEDRAREEERLMAKQQRLLEMKQSLVDDLQEREAEMNDSIHYNLRDFLKEYNKDKNYFYILGYQRGSGILLANDSLDITKEVLEGLNKK